VEKVIPIANILQQYREQSGGNKKLVKLYILECLQELGNNCYIYNQVRLIYPQENVVVLNSYSISNQNDELNFLENNAKEIILVKDTNGNFFAKAFPPPLPQRLGSRTANGMGGPNPGSGSGWGSGWESESGSCSINPTPKDTPEVVNYEFRSPPKKQKALEKMKRELQESIEEEDKLNAQRKKDGKATITLIIKDGLRFFAPNDKLRDKFHHAPDLDSPIPETLGEAELARLSKSGLYRKRLETFRNREILPEAYVEQTGRDLRLHALNPDTRIIKGTFGGNREARDGTPKIQGYHLYNDKTGFNAFFDMNGRQYRTGMKASNAQQKDLKQNNNFL
jgi:hypothetical protein